ncbi:serine/threonine-protein kinase [Fuerstiella marisgermanici]|uniref:Serine/threonine-protein kinase PrkC n=1 Tax=Fuerstiella marisgermanici TaxID=1891926 RepID=A0A1P8WRE7_9PLAN|nr:serine/threonine-protein kinase [Fuerstiella marisgermanici]APZ96633.1 Serine/threonine-protein kinase PrkC [Fuerstiella marisgermanici]
MTESSKICPQCNSELPADSAAALCPKCLLQMGFETAPDEPDSSPSYQPTFIAPTAEELEPEFPQLEILEQIGHGGMGVVYKARQIELDRIVALKILRPNISNDAKFAERFQREARALAKLNHPNIVTVYDFGRKDALFYFIMEYVDGTNLRHLERVGQLDPRQALTIVPQVCAALQYAHDNGVVHRDIKPENILISMDGDLRIADFGLAKLAGKTDDAPLTGTWQVMGTPHYMAPEQFEKPNTVDHRADIYSLGVVIYELLTGELPLGRFPLPSEKVRVDVRLDEVVLRSLDKEPNRRYQRVTDVATAVENASSPSPAGFHRTEQVKQWAFRAAATAATAVGSSARSLREKTSGWEGRLRSAVDWIGARHAGIGKALMTTGLVEFVGSLLSLLGSPWRDELLFFAVSGAIFGTLAFWFGRQLRRKLPSKFLRRAAVLSLLPLSGCGAVVGVIRILLTALGLIAAYCAKPAEEAAGPPAPDIVDHLVKALRSARKAITPRIIRLTLLGVCGWCLVCGIVFSAAYGLWFHENIWSYYVANDDTGQDVKPLSGTYDSLSIRSSGHGPTRGINRSTIRPERQTLTLTGINSSPLRRATLEINLPDDSVTLRDRMSGRDETMPLSKEAIRQWMSVFAEDVESLESQKQIDNLWAVVTVMYASRGLTAYIGAKHERWYPPVERQLTNLLEDRQVMAGRLIPVGRLLDPELFATQSENSDLTYFKVQPNHELIAIGIFAAFAVWLIGMIRVARILYIHLWWPACTSDAATAIDSSAAAKRWLRCSTAMIITSLIGGMLTILLIAAADDLKISQPEVFARLGFHLPPYTAVWVILAVKIVCVTICAFALLARPMLFIVGRWLGAVAATLSLVALPVNLITFPTGLAALILLSDARVRTAFGILNRTYERTDAAE